MSVVPEIFKHRKLAVEAWMLEDYPQAQANQRRVSAEVMARQAYNT